MALADSQVFSSETLNEGIGALQHQRVKSEPDREELQAELQDIIQTHFVGEKRYTVLKIEIIEIII